MHFKHPVGTVKLARGAAECTTGYALACFTCAYVCDHPFEEFGSPDSTGYTLIYVNVLTPPSPRVLITLPLRGSGLDGGEVDDRLADFSPATVQKKVTRLNVLRHVCDALADTRATHRRNKWMIKATVVLKFMRSVTKSY